MGESVWSYPRPPRVEPSLHEVVVIHGGVEIVRTTSAFRILETSHPPVYYVPPTDVHTALLMPSTHHTFCEYKGLAHYVDLMLPGHDDRVRDAAWYYPDPADGYREITGHYAFYPGRVDACTVAGEPVTPQASDFYGGWITGDITGPFKS
jgi:uncharacterized protein (DUF427 family)